MDGAHIDQLLARWVASPTAAWLSPGILRRARKVAVLRPGLDAVLTAPAARALAGLAPAAPPDAGADLDENSLWQAIAAVDSGTVLAPALGAALAARFADDPALAVPALRLWVRTDEARERSARAALSEQELPYVFPGELHPLSIELLASADRVMTALHVDWMRKLTSWAADALTADARARGFWFWPHLPFLDERKLAPGLRKMAKVRRAPPGARGIALAYQHRVGGRIDRALAAAEPADAFVAAVAIASDRAG